VYDYLILCISSQKALDIVGLFSDEEEKIIQDSTPVLANDDIDTNPKTVWKSRIPFMEEDDTETLQFAGPSEHSDLLDISEAVQGPIKTVKCKSTAAEPPGIPEVLTKVEDDNVESKHMESSDILAYIANENKKSDILL
jgi:hypothetical protein